MNEREREINQLEIDIIGLNERYKASYKWKLFDIFDTYLEREYKRMDILNRIGEKEKELDSKKHKLNVLKCLYKLFYDCYYFVDKAIY